jgi:hypothetical protein
VSGSRKAPQGAVRGAHSLPRLHRPRNPAQLGDRTRLDTDPAAFEAELAAFTQRAHQDVPPPTARTPRLAARTSRLARRGSGLRGSHLRGFAART